MAISFNQFSRLRRLLKHFKPRRWVSHEALCTALGLYKSAYCSLVSCACSTADWHELVVRCAPCTLSLTALTNDGTVADAAVTHITAQNSNTIGINPVARKLIIYRPNNAYYCSSPRLPVERRAVEGGNRNYGGNERERRDGERRR